MIPENLQLETAKVILRPLSDKDYDAFLALAKADIDTWSFFSLNLGDPEQLTRWMELAHKDRAANTRRPFTIIEKATGQIAGSSSMGNISPYDLRLEIGWSWLGLPYRQTGINKHAKFAMMRYAFEDLGYERVEFKTDVQNARARKGLQNIGGTEEGILRSHMTMWNNRRRTSIYYSVLKNEWPAIRETIFKDFS
ncbi:MAG: GNAT family N-acetyltransferase [Terrimonas sp.]|nr:GNAT family N-acetyltransferase [Terrimonas sp.]